MGISLSGYKRFLGKLTVPAVVREQFNRNVTTLLTHSDLSSDLTVFGGLYQQRLGPTYFGAANYLTANVVVLQ